MNIDLKWLKCHPEGRLRAEDPPTICGLSMHFEAYRVRRLESGIVEAFYHDWDPEVEAILEICLHHNPETVEIPGHEGDWIIVAIPYEN